ncbi:hypothetical protein CVT26_001873 [Gymnopilus dilepis]|uniref:Histone deacetylase interacting domain-containing protein n=1 Tax=Gymnopilus dilepis TaxID=231916 RepID=A0A409Y3W5_9AGAR|nr:hypothetical protein CVT26_001873 [Gymnopilus dilepis]
MSPLNYPTSESLPPLLNQSLSYISAVKATYEHDPDIFNQFVNILQEFRGSQVDTLQTIKNVCQLFQGNPALIQGFQAFLPVDYTVEVFDVDSRGAGIITITTPSGAKIQSRNLGSGVLTWSMGTEK